MALQKSIEWDATGVWAAYWRVMEVVINAEHGFVEIRLGGYLDKDSRDAGKFPCFPLGYRLTGDDLTGYFKLDDLEKGNPFKQAYKWVKRNAAAFDGSLDI